MTELQIAVLAFEPHANGLAYASFAKGGDLIDWGSFDVRARRVGSKRRLCRQLVLKLAPATIGLEDVDQPDCRRSKRTRAFLRSIRQDVLDGGFQVARVPRDLIAQYALRRSNQATSQAALHRDFNQAAFLAIHDRTRSVPVRKAMRIGLAVLYVAGSVNGTKHLP